MSDISVNELSKELQDAIEGMRTTEGLQSTGIVTRVGDGVAWIYGLSDAGFNEVVTIETSAGGTVEAFVLNLLEDEIGEYSGSVKEVAPITIATYQILTTKRKEEYSHLALLNNHDWGLIIYDEVHLLPAPIFKMTADLQARRRLGLTATLVREDGKEGDVFSLIGPKRFDAPWKEIEEQGYIAPAN